MKPLTLVVGFAQESSSTSPAQELLSCFTTSLLLVTEASGKVMVFVFCLKTELTSIHPQSLKTHFKRSLCQKNR
ncbi:MAG: hypothetical protein KME31_15655 [Tolypothrix carrinoi HA7290-LM1]|nr:hypothetical protein [Tolypothrix carrinoi HA7290-LM1]